MGEWANAKAIETPYKGRRFRSRLEARWAVFYDALGVDWCYEPEGFNLGRAFYLPDFWLPGLQCWVEIKPTLPSGEEYQKAALLVEHTGKPTYLCFGPFGLPWEQPAPHSYSAELYSPEETLDVFGEPCRRYEANCWWSEELATGRFSIQPYGMADDQAPAGFAPDTERLLAAYGAGLAARFERWGQR